MPKFTVKQQRFIDAYEGNATEAARKAGYSKKTAEAIGHENLRKPYIAEAIAKREEKRGNKAIATREERQKFWTKVLNGEFAETVKIIKDGEYTTDEIPPKMSDRLKASELLGRSEADFVDRHQVDLSMGNLEKKQREAEDRVNGGSG